MTCDLTPFLTVFRSYQDEERLKMKGRLLRTMNRSLINTFSNLIFILHDDLHTSSLIDQFFKFFTTL